MRVHLCMVWYFLSQYKSCYCVKLFHFVITAFLKKGCFKEVLLQAVCNVATNAVRYTFYTVLVTLTSIKWQRMLLDILFIRF